MRSILVVCPAVIILVSIALSQCEERTERIVRIAQGPVRGYKENDVFAYYGIPYATAPTGKHRFKAPLPPPAWLSTFEANNQNIVCPQIVDAMFLGKDKIVQEDCLIANVFVPDTSETNLPVVVYVHGGGFRIGFGEFFTAKEWLKKKEFVFVTFNYRLGPHGFLCLGTEDVPGNAGLKDQVALLRWVRDNIASFNGNPDDVTIAGYSAGAVSVDLLMLSPLAKGLFNKVIPESGSNLAAFNVQTDPIGNARKYAKLLNFSNVDNIYDLEHFYKTTALETLYADVFSDMKQSPADYDTFSPCIERSSIGGKEETFLANSPFSILKSGQYEKVPILYGFSEMEGLLVAPFFDVWKNSMNKKFSDFLPPNLQFKDDDEKEKVANEIKEFYFGSDISKDSILAYVDYFSDVYFAYPTIQAVKLHLNAGHEKIYLYEYSYVDPIDTTNSSLVPYTDNIHGATHCAQTMALFDGHGLVRPHESDLSVEYLKVKSLMRELWTNFITTGSPVPEGSPLLNWPVTGVDASPYMILGREMALQSSPLYERRVRLWDEVYQRHYRAPAPPPVPQLRNKTDL